MKSILLAMFIVLMVSVLEIQCASIKKRKYCQKSNRNIIVSSGNLNSEVDSLDEATSLDDFQKYLTITYNDQTRCNI
jgi:hypothetical protein